MIKIKSISELLPPTKDDPRISQDVQLDGVLQSCLWIENAWVPAGGMLTPRQRQIWIEQNKNIE